MSESLTCWIYKSPKREGMYLYLRSEDDFSAVPEPLLAQFGSPQRVVELELSPGRKLARAESAEVMARLREEGFYLQMPPPDPWL